MSTEDETFRVLKQTPFRELDLLIHEIQIQSGWDGVSAAHKMRLAVAEHGWTVETYISEKDKTK